MGGKKESTLTDKNNCFRQLLPRGNRTCEQGCVDGAPVRVNVEMMAWNIRQLQNATQGGGDPRLIPLD